ncbi:MAG: hypothetical protein GY754_22715 [bacterium]|nr:hypothetical protein [bacterium]
MKKITRLFNSAAIHAIIFTIILTAIPALAGDLHVGVQGRYSFMNSGLAQITVNAVEAQINRELGLALANTFSGTLTSATLAIGAPETSGVISGPIISYITEDKTWEFTAYGFFLGSYTTTVDATVSLGIGLFTVPITVNTEFDITHRDIGGKVSRYFFDMLRVSAGYDYLYYETGLKTSYDASTYINFSSSLDFTFVSHMHIVYLGTGLRYPLKDFITLDADFNFGCPVGGSLKQDMIISYTINTPGSTNITYNLDSGNVDWAYFLMGEVSASFLLAETITLKIGYQLQTFNMKLSNVDTNADGAANESTQETNLFHGFVFQADYKFNL